MTIWGHFSLKGKMSIEGVPAGQFVLSGVLSHLFSLTCSVAVFHLFWLTCSHLFTFCVSPVVRYMHFMSPVLSHLLNLSCCASPVLCSPDHSHLFYPCVATVLCHLCATFSFFTVLPALSHLYSVTSCVSPVVLQPVLPVLSHLLSCLFSITSCGSPDPCSLSSLLV